MGGQTFGNLAVDPNNPNVDQAVTWTAIAMAESGGNTDAHAPPGEDSRGLWQINVDPAQTASDLFKFQLDLICEKTDQATDMSPWTVTHATPASGRGDEGPEETITFVFGRLGDGGSIDGVAVDPSNPNSPTGRTDGVFTVVLPSVPLGNGTSDVDGRDFLVWQKGNGTPGLDDGLLLPAVQDDGLLLPAVQTDNGLLLPY